MLFVPKAKFTYAVKGEKKVRLIGVGENDKAQITCTLFISEAGECLPAQMIFGGKTKRSLPSGGNNPAPPGILWDFTLSHWQTPESYCKLIRDIIIPYKTAKIVELGLPVDQATIVKHDLHYSHKDPEVLQLLRDNRIFPVFVPGRCTDVLQECDTVLNAPFKKEVRACFRNYLHAEFDSHVANNPDADPLLWTPTLTGSVLKPQITGWVLTALTSLRTDAMRATIREAFRNDGCMTEIRGLPRRIAYLANANQIPHEIVVPAEVEEENIEEIAMGGDANEYVLEDVPVPVRAVSPVPARAVVPVRARAADLTVGQAARREVTTKKCYSCAKFCTTTDMLKDVKLNVFKCRDCWFAEPEL